MENRKKTYTKKGNQKKAPYELVCNWVSETWKEISPNILVKSLEASGLILNPNGSEDDKMSQRLQAIVKDRLNELSIENARPEEPNYDNGELDDDELDSSGPDYYELYDTEPDDSELDDEVNELGDIEADYYDENFMDLDSYEKM